MTKKPRWPVHGRDDLTCPVSPTRIATWHTHAFEHPWPGNRPLDCPAHFLNTTAITEPGRPVRAILSLDHGYHRSGWFANSDYERCLHLSLSYPRPDRRVLYPGKAGAPVPHVGQDMETPSDAEVWAWGHVVYHDAVRMAWLEPAASVFDPYRAPHVVHLRLYLNQTGEPFIPRGEVYDLRPYPDGSSPAKITDGRAGADVR